MTGGDIAGLIAAGVFALLVLLLAAGRSTLVGVTAGTAAGTAATAVLGRILRAGTGLIAACHRRSS